MASPAFKSFDVNQNELFPVRIDDLIDDDHKARFLSAIVDRLDISAIYNTYHVKGASSYHPKMLLKVLLFAYSEKIFSARKIAEALKRDVVFMWLSGRQTPDFRTINIFRSNRLNEIKKVFTSLVMNLEKYGLIDLTHYFLDGTIFEANANKFKLKYKKNTERYKKQVINNIEEIFNDIGKLEELEEKKYKGKDLPDIEAGEITSNMVDDIANQLQETMDANETKNQEERNKHKKLNKVKNKLEKYNKRLRKHEKDEEDLAGRGGCSRTDTDATAMRTKDDIFRNGALRACYSTQCGTQNQYIVWVSLHNTPVDSLAMKPHIEDLKMSLERLPEAVIADAGYGTTENYEYLTEQGIDDYVKYGSFEKERKDKFKNNPFESLNFRYDEDRDEYICPAERRMKMIDSYDEITKTGFVKPTKVYQTDCEGCELKQKCYPKTGNRKLHICKKSRKHKLRARDKLESDRGKMLRKQRPVEVETVFGNIKQNLNFKRFNLRGIGKCSIEMILICLVHNINKLQLDLSG